MGQTISQIDSNSTENYFLRETEIFLFLSESRTVPNTPLNLIHINIYIFELDHSQTQSQYGINHYIFELDTSKTVNIE
jgi:hypothetical protein